MLAFYAAATERVAAILVTTHTTEQAAVTLNLAKNFRIGPIKSAYE